MTIDRKKLNEKIQRVSMIAAATCTNKPGDYAKGFGDGYVKACEDILEWIEQETGEID